MMKSQIEWFDPVTVPLNRGRMSGSLIRLPPQLWECPGRGTRSGSLNRLDAHDRIRVGALIPLNGC
jgi:hypothetical protein